MSHSRQTFGITLNYSILNKHNEGERISNESLTYWNQKEMTYVIFCEKDWHTTFRSTHEDFFLITSSTYLQGVLSRGFLLIRSSSFPIQSKFFSKQKQRFNINLQFLRCIIHIQGRRILIISLFFHPESLKKMRSLGGKVTSDFLDRTYTFEAMMRNCFISLKRIFEEKRERSEKHCVVR